MTRKELRRGSDRKEAIVREIVAARVASPIIRDRRQVRRFLEQYVSDVPFEDLEGRSPTIMARIALDHLAIAETRRRGQPRLRIFNATEAEHGYSSNYTFIEIVNDDMPFLVNSLAAAINRHDLNVHITVHPIIRVHRDSEGNLESICKPGDESGQPESFIRLAIDKETDAKRLKAIEKEIRTVVSDIRLEFKFHLRYRHRHVDRKAGFR